MADLQKLVDELSGLTVLEAAELSKLLEEKWGVSAAAPVAAAAAPAGGGARPPRRSRSRRSSPSSWPRPGTRRSTSSRRVRTITGLGLKEAKDLVEGAPKTGEGRREQGRGREDQEAARGSGRRCRGQVDASRTTRRASGSAGPAPSRSERAGIARFPPPILLGAMLSGGMRSDRAAGDCVAADGRNGRAAGQSMNAITSRLRGTSASAGASGASPKSRRCPT